MRTEKSEFFIIQSSIIINQIVHQQVLWYSTSTGGGFFWLLRLNNTQEQVRGIIIPKTGVYLLVRAPVFCPASIHGGGVGDLYE